MAGFLAFIVSFPLAVDPGIGVWVEPGIHGMGRTVLSELGFLLSGIVFGLAAGISPGPLLTLVISETIRYGVREGARVALAPLVTDFPIVLMSLLVLSRLAHAEPVLGVISMLGGIFVGYLAYESITTKAVELDLRNVKAQSLRKGIITNFLNPHPYMFWLAVGGPMLFKALDAGALCGLLFISGFYLLIVGSKIAVAMGVGRFRPLLKSRPYLYTMRVLGLALLFFAALFVRDGLKLFGLI